MKNVVYIAKTRVITTTFKTSRSMKSLRYCLVALMAAVGTTSIAQIASDGSLPAANKFDSVEVIGKSATSNVLRQRSLVAKRIYGNDEIERFGDTNLLDSLSNLPGVQIHNGLPALSGMDPKYTKLLFNGDPAPAGVSLAEVSPSLIERIEIVRGQSANQSAQSIAGTINIIFKEAPRTSKESTRLGVQYQNERPTPIANYTIGGSAGDFSYNIPITVTELIQTFQVNSDKRIVETNGAISSGYQERYWRYGNTYLTINPRFNYTINDDEKLVSQNSISLSNRQLLHRYEKIIFSGDPQLNNDFESRTTVKSLGSNLSWVKNLGSNDSIEAKVGIDANVMDGCWLTQEKQQPLLLGCWEQNDSNIRYAGNYTHIINNSHILTAGFSVDRNNQSDNKKETYLSSPVNSLLFGQTISGAVDTSAVYIQDEWEISKAFSVNLGLRAERINLSSSVPDQIASQMKIGSSVVTNKFVNPIAHFSYRPNPATKQVLRGSLSRGYKAPNLALLSLIPDFFVQDTTRTNSAASPDTVGNSLLKPELATGVDISYETSFGKNGFASLGAFYRDVDNIVANTTTLQTVYWASQPRWVSQPTNFSHGTSYGIEMEFRAGAADLLPAALQPKMPLNFRLNLNYYGSQVDGVPGPDNRFPSQSPWKTTIGFDYKPIDNLTLGGSIYFAPEYMRRITAIQTFKQMPLRWINAFARYSIDKRSNIRVGINNLFPSSNATEAVTDLSSVNAVRSGRTNISVTIETQLK